MSNELPAPEPSVTPETEPFWEATADERLLLCHCSDCDATYHYPRAHCPECFSDDTEWVEASGDGTIYTYTVVRQPMGSYGKVTPYVLAYVELAEGPRIITNIVETDGAPLKIGQPVSVVFDETDGDSETKLPRFVPV